MERQPRASRVGLAEAARAPRFRNRRKANVAGWLRNLLLLAILGQAVRILVTAPVLQVRNVEVLGSERMSAVEVSELAEVEFGANIFRANLGVAARNLRRDPIIKHVAITRLPPATLQIRITDRQPAMLIRAGGKSWEVDSAGLLYREALGPEPDLPVLALPVEYLPRPGERIESSLWKTVNECIDLASREQLVLRGMRVTEKREMWVDLELDETREEEQPQLPVRLGRLVDLEPKFRDIRTSVLGWPGLAQSSRYLDVMCPGRPAFKSANSSDEG